MTKAIKAAAHLTIDELQRIAAAKFAEAEAFPNGPEKQKVLQSAQSFRSLAKMKGWLFSELRPPN